MFPDLSENAARAEIDPFNEKFIAAIKEGVRKFNAIEPSLLLTLVRWKRVKANAIWSFIQVEIENVFRGVNGIRVVPRHGSIEIEIGGNTIARIKKMREDGFTSNYMTARVTEFHSAGQGELFGDMWAQPMKVDIGYIEDATGTQVAQIMVARRDRPNHVAWKYGIMAPAAVTPMPIQPAAAEEAGEQTRIVPREDDKESAHGTDDK